MRNSSENSNRKVILAIVITVIVILVLIGTFLLFKNYENKRLNTAFSLGYNKSLQDVAQGQTQTGSILTWQNEKIEIVNIQDICNPPAQ